VTLACRNPFRTAYLLLVVSSLRATDGTGYLGRDVCAGCHRDIAISQSRTNMARTWQGVASPQLPANYSQTHTEGPAPAIEYALKRAGEPLQYRVQMPGHPPQEFPIETMVGGERHGISFLLRVPAVENLPLPVARLVEARYFHSASQNRLAFSLGFPEEKPSTYETAFGRVLTPYLEKRCLSCHVAPRSQATRAESGVSCENCHGPGQPHLAALSRHSEAHKPPGPAPEVDEAALLSKPKTPDGRTSADLAVPGESVVRGSSKNLGILNPNKLPVADRMRPCSQCHAGSSLVEDPLPSDLLISDQVTALKNSECWRQSGGNIACTNCHDPHKDAPRPVLVARA
jgi:hypothetical protein